MLKNFEGMFNKYSVLYDEEDEELEELDRFENRFKEANVFFTHFENIQKDLKKVKELDKNAEEKILESRKMTSEIMEEMKKLKKEKYTIRKKEKMYDKILRKYSLSPLSYNNLTDINVSLNIAFFEHLKQFEYTKENIIKLLNENSTDKINKFYSKHYSKILNKACKKMCLYVIRENNNSYRKIKKVTDLLLCPISEEKEKRKIIIRNYVQNFSPLTKLCYKIIIENMEYFNICFTNFLHFRIKLFKRNYNDLFMSHGSNIVRRNNSEGEFPPIDDSIEIFKNFFSTIYYLITLEDHFFKILLLFNYYYTNVEIPYITAQLENMHNNLYTIIDSLYFSYSHFLETNLSSYPKSYDTCYELFHIVDMFIFKLKKFQNNCEITQDAKDIIRENSIEMIRLNNPELNDRQINGTNLYSAVTLHENTFLENYKFNSGKGIHSRNSINSILWNFSRNIADDTQSKLPSGERPDQMNEEQLFGGESVNNINTEYYQKSADREEIKNVGIETNVVEEQGSLDEAQGGNVKRHSSDEIAIPQLDNDTRSNVEDAQTGRGRSELGEKNSGVEKYNCKLLNYTQKIQKKIENEFIALWQKDVVTFYLSKITKVDEPNYFDNTLSVIKKIFNALNHVYSIYRRNIALFGSESNEQNFQNVLDITINPLINNSLKNKNQNVERDYIFIINIFIFMQENVKMFEGSSKYYDLLGIIIHEKMEKVLELENNNLLAYLKLDKIRKEEESNIKEVELILENFYKFAFSENFNDFPVVNKIQSSHVKKEMHMALFNNIHKEYVHLYEMYSKKVNMLFPPDQIKDVLLKKLSVI
ncbi:conserved Plasmodium protein, unknown function [Plasmodium knowlesi strain H]|uniref:Uncharacterized protein n=3 Tax=Plasmodium knowlesi TaxID=5850 RepID=A0A5K1VCZ9_PLAKH|nr:conserved oligomeric Golgi complex subunit 6, putative [Plasmodium knowlesi strain H]OTN65602.1 Uncharacterized protein PKNOH_S110086900 [Plasmodium knowlesi]CAA9989490.1 conserved oligomeric Golgi complex subunit 6, putative [Plasmodium knowlesi strain H]SBO25161.1 conserved Plasmodium protein, unknown function [Plasmodium knowlesi strain H]SBO27782.1 conserved Plasmodium protein, unknown function [Plasmodium knowlesi strain H]VVS78964.1 conserved oligomeric Golgi complex subunit 6, putati|eukprot:XP_002260215.1 hypothetical protein, conserved in Plasmodium species [Plasmodium knowlesi strain H]